MELDQRMVERIVGEDPALSIVKFPSPLFKDGFIICSIETKLLGSGMTIKYKVPQEMLVKPIKRNQLISVYRLPKQGTNKLLSYLTASCIYVEFRAA